MSEKNLETLWMIAGVFKEEYPEKVALLEKCLGENWYEQTKRGPASSIPKGVTFLELETAFDQWLYFVSGFRKAEAVFK